MNQNVQFQLEDRDNANFAEITKLLPAVSEPESSTTFTHLKSIKNFILHDLDEYYTYHGSLTTPPCSEVVTWIDFKQSIPLSHSQVNLLFSGQKAFSLMFSHFNNFRQRITEVLILRQHKRSTFATKCPYLIHFFGPKVSVNSCNAKSNRYI